MDIPNVIQMLDAEWDEVEGQGFFAFLRKDVFDEDGFKRVKGILNSIELPDGETLDKRFVEVTWFIPTFMRWQQDVWRIDGKDTRQLDEAIAFVEQRLTTILGLP
jgi:hypothetical protein